MAKPSNAKRRTTPAPAPPPTKSARADRPAGGGGARSRPGWVIPAAVAAAVVALFVVAALVTSLGGGESDGDLAQTRPVTVTGAPLPERPKEGPDPAVGMAGPTVSGASFDGRPVQIGGTGRPTLVFFVAHWCPHCQREVPLLAPELDRITPDGVDVVTVSTGTNPNAGNHPPSKWLRDEGWPTPVLADDAGGAAAKAYGLSGYPFFVLLDGDGKVVRRGSGEKPVAEVEALLEEVARGAVG